MCSGMGDRTCLLPGFPIRTSPDQSSVDSSPGLFAASHVLLRLLVPRHPPCALTNLATKMLASTVQFSSYGRAQPRTARRVRAKRRVVRREAGPSRGEPANPSEEGLSGLVASEESNRSLRTQQRAWADPVLQIPFPPREAVLGDPRHRAGLLVSVPLHEPIPRHSL